MASRGDLAAAGPLPRIGTHQPRVFDLNGHTHFEFAVLVAADQPQRGVPYSLSLNQNTRGADTRIAQHPFSLLQNFGNDVHFIAEDPNGAVRIAGLIRFDLAAIPADVQIDSATLRLYLVHLHEPVPVRTLLCRRTMGRRNGDVV